MTKRSVTHATFVVERTYDASPARVFAAWADPAAKVRWFAPPDEEVSAEFELDFRVGGHEISRGGLPDGQSYGYEARYQDIVPEARIVYTYEMQLNGNRVSVSVATVELEPKGAGTRLVVTEQGAYLDGHDSPDLRQKGTGELLDALGAELRRPSASA